jgi:RHS repeat-associated protein
MRVVSIGRGRPLVARRAGGSSVRGALSAAESNMIFLLTALRRLSSRWSQREVLRSAASSCLAVALVGASLSVLAEPVFADPPPSGSAEFSYTGAAQSWTVPAGVTSVTVDASGAQGGNTSYGGLGGHVQATLAVSPGEVLQVNVGGTGAVDAAGFNGGGSAAQGGFGGGGATDVRKNGVTLAARVVVAAGGGGAGEGGAPAGSGGYPAGSAGGSCGGAGGSQTAGGAGGQSPQNSAYNGGAGSLGQGGAGSDYLYQRSGGGGGGGYYGGGGGCSLDGGAGGGGSSWVSPSATGTHFDTGVRLGHGTVTIFWPPTTPPPVSPTPGSATFSFTGGPQWFTVPEGVAALAVDAAGAQGGNTGYGGLGGRLRATLAVTPGEVLQVNVGGAGALEAAGFNGGGSAAQGGFGGGGASDVRKNGVTLAARVAVAAGGGGAGEGGTPAGSGGRPSGTAGGSCGGAGGSQTAGGAGGQSPQNSAYSGGAGTLGQGGAGNDYLYQRSGGGGGGGYYGGGGGCSLDGGAGGGGSSWVTPSGTGTRFDTGVGLGNGTVTISWPPVTPAPVTATPDSATFSHTANPQWFTVPEGIHAVLVNVAGAQGGSGGTAGGLGAQVQATLAVSPGEVLQVNVGGTGATDAAGFNGGGSAAQGGIGGGGASDIRKNGVTLTDRLVVAGGGGGAGESFGGPGGAGGNPNGGAGQSSPCGGGGATQAAGGTAGEHWTSNATVGTLGQGGKGGDYVWGSSGGGGGGGYYGGGGGASSCGGGGGGSSWINPAGAFSGAYLSSTHSGNGEVTISWPVARDVAAAFGVDSYGEMVQNVHLGSGNLVESVTDVEIATAGPDLELARTYNSLDSTIGWLGKGWTSTYERSAVVDVNGDVVITYPDGRRERHRLNPDGSFTAPVSYVSTLTARVGGGWELRHKDRSLDTFDAAGHLSAMADSYGRTLTFAWNGGQLASVTDAASGRFLSFTWAGSHIDTVSTNTVSGPGYSGPLTWRYVYTGDLLTKVCDARNNDPVTGSCVTYGYTDGRLTTIVRPKGNTSLEVAYQADGRVDWTENGVNNRVDLAYWDGVSTITDARGYVTHYFYDPLFRTTMLIDPAGGITSYRYDGNGFRSEVSDPNANTVKLGYDAKGNLVSQTNAEGETTWFAYDADSNLTARRDGRSSGATDDTYKTSFTYNSSGDKLTETSPPTTEHAGGVTQTWTYTAGGEDHGYGANVPAGLLRSVHDGLGTTTYDYDPAGDLRRVTTPSGLQTSYGRDGLGRATSETVTWDGGASATTTRSFDQLGQPLVVTEPAVTSAVGGPPVTHQRQTTTDYDANSNPWRVTVHDAGDLATATPDRVTTVDFDDADRPWRTTDPETWITTRSFDANGNVVTVTDPEGRVLRTDYDERNRPVAVVQLGFVDDPLGGSTPRDVVLSRTDYDAAGRKTAEYTPRPGTGGRPGQLSPSSTPMAKRRFAYDKADRVLSVTFEAYTDHTGASHDVVLEATVYDDAGNPTVVSEGDAASVVTNTFDAASRLQTATLELGATDRTSEFDYDPAGHPTRQSVTQGSSSAETRRGYDSAGRLTSQTVENGAADLVTTFGYDQRGLRLWTVDPRGNAAGATEADYRAATEYDVLGRVVTETAPPVSVEEVGGTPVVGRPTVRYGYDAVGNRVTAVDPRGNITTQVFDRLDRRVRINHPVYTPPGGTQLTPFEAYGYDRVGNLVASTDRRGQTTDYLFDARNRVVRQLDPQVTGQPTRGATLLAYDDAGNRTSVTDPTGAATTFAADDLGRPRTTTQVVRQDAPAGSFTTTFDHDALGNQTWTQDPTGVTTTKAYTAASEVASVTDALGKTTTFGYDAAGRRTVEVDPLGRRVEHVYDPAGRETSTVFKEPGTGAVLATDYRAYDPAGNQTAYRSARSASATDDTYRTSFVYDALGRLTQVVEPDAAGPLTSSYGYDAAGNTTRVTDGRGNVTTATFTPWNTKASTVEPSTAGQTAAADRTFAVAYDAAGLPLTETQPGVTISRTFDNLGRLTAEDGNGAGVASATRSFGYDLAGRRTTVGHPSGDIALSNDDRGLLLSASVPGSASVASSFRYDGAGRMTSRADAAGTATFTYTARGELDVATDPLTGVSVNHDWNDAGQVATITYGTSPGRTRTFAYDGRGRLDTDTLTDGTSTLAKADYDYDPDNNLVGQAITAPGNPAAGAHAYAYDRSGRLDTWTAPGGAVTDYDYDPAGNRIRAGSTFTSYDARNRLTAETVFDLAAPSVPTNLAATASGARRVDLTWSASTDNTGVAGYTILRDGVVVGTTTATSFSDTTAMPSTAYAYRVEAFDVAANRSAGSAPVNATTPASPVSSIILHGTATNATGSATSLSITKPANTAANDTLVAVIAVRNGASGSVNVTGTGWTPVGAVANGSAMKLFTFTKLAAGEASYTFTISPAAAAAGAVAAYGGVSTTVPRDGENNLAYPSNTTVKAPSVTTTAANDVLIGGFGTAASTTFSSPGGSGSLTVRAQQSQGGSTKISVALADLALAAPGATGEKTLTAGSAALNAGQQVALRPAGAEPPDTVLPGAPGTPVATPAAGPVQVGLTWPAGTDNVGVVSYRVNRDNTLVGHTSTTSFTDTQVAASTAYSYTVETVDAAGNRSAPSAAVNVTTPAGAAGTLATSYTWTPRGTLTTVNNGTSTTVGFDALGRQTAWGATSYGYDALDRIATRDATGFGYAGTELDPVAMGTERYSRTPAGELLAVQVNGAARLVGENRHGDVAWLLDATGTVTDSRVWDPYGQPAGATGATNPSVGYQGDYTDPSSGDVWMGARWYMPETGGFTSRDTVFGMLKTPVSLNRYTYANGDPLEYFDPDGRFADMASSRQARPELGEVTRSAGNGSSSVKSSESSTTAAAESFMRTWVRSRAQHKPKDSLLGKGLRLGRSFFGGAWEGTVGLVSAPVGAVRDKIDSKLAPFRLLNAARRGPGALQTQLRGEATNAANRQPQVPPSQRRPLTRAPS